MAIARVKISGTINQGTASAYVEILNFLRTRKKFKGVILEINSGGGDANSSQILFEAIRKLDSDKPVYAVIEGMGASGAYWIASGARRIFAMSTSLVGSIGLISISPNLTGLLQKVGVDVRVYKIGKFKDLLSPFSSENQEEGLAHFHEAMSDIFEVFRSAVAERRGISFSEMETIATGEVFSAQKARSLKLIDDIGNVDTALEDMKNRFKVYGTVRTLSPRRPFITRFIGRILGEIVSNIQ